MPDSVKPPCVRPGDKGEKGTRNVSSEGVRNPAATSALTIRSTCLRLRSSDTLFFAARMPLPPHSTRDLQLSQPVLSGPSPGRGLAKSRSIRPVSISCASLSAANSARSSSSVFTRKPMDIFPRKARGNGEAG